MALPGSGGLQGTKQTVVDMWRLDGIRAFYKGFGTVWVGTIPSRVVYISTLEMMKSGLATAFQHSQVSDVGSAGFIHLIAGGAASLCSQAVFVPIDVISQRQMVLNSPIGKGSVRVGGISMAKQIFREEGLRGFWRGLSVSIMTFVPHSAIWWGAYGSWQKILWHQLDFWRAASQTGPLSMVGSCAETTTAPQSTEPKMDPRIQRLPRDVIGVQTSSALLAGISSAIITTPLDVVKTTLQLAKLEDGKQPTISGTIVSILQRDGLRGFLRGMLPRMANVALWGTCTVSAYELLKRMSVRQT